MEQDKNIILVTWDFTEKSEHAVEHAKLAAKRLNLTLGLVNIVKKDTEVKAVTERLEGVIASKYSDIEPKPLAIVKDGNIFTTITDLANEMGARMVFMGTHGIKGMQKFLGSWALKVIAHTKVPFVVVQNNPITDQYQDIVVPITFRSENKESTGWINFFDKYFGSRFYFLKAKHTDPNFVKGIDSNIFFLRKYFASKGIPFHMEEATGDTDFVIEIIQYVAKIGADSIMLMITKDIGFADYVLGAHEQYIIANEEKIPVICINPKPPKFGGSFSASGG